MRECVRVRACVCVCMHVFVTDLHFLILIADLYFLIQWLEEEDKALFDVIPARDVKAHDERDIIHLAPGGKCLTCFNNTFYSGDILASGVQCTSIFDLLDMYV